MDVTILLTVDSIDLNQPHSQAVEKGTGHYRLLFEKFLLTYKLQNFCLNYRIH